MDETTGLDTTDGGMVTMVMGLSNVLTSHLPAAWSRIFPVIPLILGAVYAFARPAASLMERLFRAAVGVGAMGEYSLLRNVMGKPAPKSVPTP